ncbi:MAG: ATP phosphoribosyltransferase [Clostridiales bacterium]|nr:ATP phosphoribosyltransferase [Clostridiales bacterium]
MQQLTVALAKGRLAEKTVEILEQCGINCAPLKESTRKLVLYDADKKYRFIFVKPADVPTYIERGVADIGVVGKDTLLEESKDIYEMLDLRFGACRMCVAGFREKQEYVTHNNLRVASKYIHIAKDFYAAKGIDVDIVKLTGSVELGPVIGLTDVIVDIVESGKTLEANGLVVLEEICKLSARLVVNKVSLKTRKNEIMPLIAKMQQVIEQRS